MKLIDDIEKEIKTLKGSMNSLKSELEILKRMSSNMNSDAIKGKETRISLMEGYIKGLEWVLK